MGRVHATERDPGGNIMMLTCSHCNETSEVWYKTCPPQYCSDRCKQAAYRERRKQREPVTDSTPANVTGFAVAEGLGKRGARLYNTVRTDFLEIRIATYKAKRQYTEAQTLYELAQAIGAPIRQDVIDTIAKERARWYE